ncbi:YidC/Oxa1 family membrane protein insertase [Patescibacteria group bacterium]|nr:YidC/Oxa1 family membrane protein insertase [Patescibacteria group bacterium]MBU2220598.1 YidC/Oxa1 family membrane protein insertase [Patescibacteria group bacterium]
MTSFFHTVLYVPIYNLLIFLTDIIPGQDIGIAVIVATLIVKFIIMPLSFSALRTARAVKVIEPELKEVREKYKDDKEKQAKEMFALYKAYGINPLAGFLTLLIQLPIVISLYWVFNSKELLTVDPSLLYPFVGMPEAVSPAFLGVFAIVGSSIVLAVLAGVTQLIQAWYAIPVPEKSTKKGGDMQADFGRAMALQMRFLLPIFIAFAAYFTSVAIALYFITSNVVSIAQEYIVRKQGIKPKVEA